jgi:hypothetical protein
MGTEKFQKMFSVKYRTKRAALNLSSIRHREPCQIKYLRPSRKKQKSPKSEKYFLSQKHKAKRGNTDNVPHP